MFRVEKRTFYFDLGAIQFSASFEFVGARRRQRWCSSAWHLSQHETKTKTCEVKCSKTKTLVIIGPCDLCKCCILLLLLYIFFSTAIQAIASAADMLATNWMAVLEEFWIKRLTSVRSECEQNGIACKQCLIHINYLKCPRLSYLSISISWANIYANAMTFLRRQIVSAEQRLEEKEKERERIQPARVRNVWSWKMEIFKCCWMFNKAPAEDKCTYKQTHIKAHSTFEW